MDATLKCYMLSCATADVVNGLGLVPLEDNLATLARLHDVETLLEVGNGETVCDDWTQVETRDEHLLHLVPCLPHLTAIDALDGESLEDNLAPVNSS